MERLYKHTIAAMGMAMDGLLSESAYRETAGGSVNKVSSSSVALDKETIRNYQTKQPQITKAAK